MVNNNLTLKFYTFIIGFCLILFGGCKFNKGEIFLIPENFRGEVRIEFNHPKGVKQTFENQSYVFVVPENGVLLSAHVNDRCDNPVEYREFYLVSKDGKRKRLSFVKSGQIPPSEAERQKVKIYNFSSQFSTKKYTPLVLMSGCWINFYVGSYDSLAKRNTPPNTNS